MRLSNQRLQLVLQSSEGRGSVPRRLQALMDDDDLLVAFAPGRG